MPKKYATLADRIIANSVTSDTYEWCGSRCWEWTGKTRTNRAGVKYGAMTRRDKRGKVQNVAAHRASIEAFTGRKPRRDVVGMHLCNYSLCVNPAHLRGGLQSTNIKQCVRDRRHFTPFRKGAKHG